MLAVAGVAIAMDLCSGHFLTKTGFTPDLFTLTLTLLTLTKPLTTKVK